MSQADSRHAVDTGCRRAVDIEDLILACVGVETSLTKVLEEAVEASTWLM